MPHFVTPPGILSYPHFWVPKARAKGGEAVFSGMLMFDKKALNTPAYKALYQGCVDIGKEAYPKKKFGTTLKSPFRSSDEKENLPEDIVIFINPWTKGKPGVIDTSKEEILDSSDVWAGQLVRMDVTPFAYENSGKYGVSLALNHVQVLKSAGMKRLDGRKSAAESFDDEYDGYVDEEEEEV